MFSYLTINLYSSQIGFGTNDIDTMEMPFETEKQIHEETGYYGWVDEDKIIHFWIDRTKNIPIEELLHFLGHEIGHQIGTPNINSAYKEELRADEYGFAARLAYDFTQKIMKRV